MPDWRIEPDPRGDGIDGAALAQRRRGNYEKRACASR
jgi:hypothetical protein